MNKPYRDRVELVIWRDEKILVTINQSKDGVWYGLPGGGRDHGEPFKHAAIREALEEVGVLARMVVSTKYSTRKEGYRSEVPGREETYGGSYTRLYEGHYDRRDYSALNRDGDRTKYEFMEPMKALGLFYNHFMACGGSGRHAVDYLANRLQVTLSTGENHPLVPSPIYPGCARHPFTNYSD